VAKRDKNFDQINSAKIFYLGSGEKYGSVQS
jgi:hypothetical protein